VHQSDEGRASVAGEPEAAEVGGHALTIKKKFVLALIAYAVLGILAWTTLSDEPIRVFNANVRLRTGTLLILGLFALRAALYFWRTRIEEERTGTKPAD
jgi:asparagine N-glycosylation enzyme membrane subunit Stt3